MGAIPESKQTGATVVPESRANTRPAFHDENHYGWSVCDTRNSRPELKTRMVVRLNFLTMTQSVVGNLWATWWTCGKRCRTGELRQELGRAVWCAGWRRITRRDDPNTQKVHKSQMGLQVLWMRAREPVRSCKAERQQRYSASFVISRDGKIRSTLSGVNP